MRDPVSIWLERALLIAIALVLLGVAWNLWRFAA
jgi:hypothetical protein